MVWYSSSGVSLQGCCCHPGLLTASQHCHLLKGKPCAPSVLLSRSKKWFFLQVLDKPKKACQTQVGYVGSCPLSRLPELHKTPERKMLHSLRFMQNYLVLGKAAAKMISTLDTENAPSFLTAGRATWKITLWSLRD